MSKKNLELEISPIGIQLRPGAGGVPPPPAAPRDQPRGGLLRSTAGTWRRHTREPAIPRSLHKIFRINVIIEVVDVLFANPGGNERLFISLLVKLFYLDMAEKVGGWVREAFLV